MIKRNSHAFTRIIYTAITLMCLVVATRTLLLAQRTFAPGDKVMASPEMLKDEKYYKPCTVVKFDSTANAYLLNCDGAEYLVQSAYIRAPKADPKAEKKPDGDVAVPPKEERPPIAKPENNPETANKRDGKFKLGDRVLASPMMLKGEKYYQPCTVISVKPPNSYGLRCDPFGGISFEEYSVREDFVRPWKDAKPAPTFECSLDQPPPVNVKTASASAPVFKRIIYESEAASEPKTRVGVKFEAFEIGRPFKNVYVKSKNGLRAEEFPQNATIYPIKTKFVRCVEGTNYNIRTVVEVGNFCGRNSFGEWSCGAGGGVRVSSRPEHVPKN